MFSILLLASLSNIIGGSLIPLYPVTIPISGIGRQTHLANHIVSQPLVKTKVFVLQLEDDPYNARGHPNHQLHPSYGPSSYTEGRASFSKDTNIKYSIPVEESPWRPIFPKNYPYVHQYFDEEEPPHHGGHDDDEEEDDTRNLILPVGIKELHNPQLRRPQLNSVYKVTYDDSKSEREYPRYKTRFKCAWCHSGK